MLILSQSETAVIDSNAYARFAVIQDKIGHYHGYIVGAFTDDSKEPVQLGYYIEKDEAKEVLADFFHYLLREEAYFCFPQQGDGFVFREDPRKLKREQVDALCGRR